MAEKVVLTSKDKSLHVEAIEKLIIQKDFDLILKALKRAKKVEELLELYKKLSVVRFYLFCETDADLGQELMDKDVSINKQIKIKEKELELIK